MSWSERINWIETQRGVGAAEEVEETNVKCLDATPFFPAARVKSWTERL
jgi:hypothetical protein